MGLGDFFKNIFGKKNCDFCGEQVGMMSRNKIKNDAFICNKCKYNCSKYIRVSRFTKEELAGHIEYMKRQDRLYKEVVSETKVYTVPSAFDQQAIAFYDECGMFRIFDRHENKDQLVELFRYDQVASWEKYLEETQPAEAGKPKEFKEYGVKIKMISKMDTTSELKPGTMPHPYIVDEIKICLSKKTDKPDYADNIVFHFDHIFGVNDNKKGLLSFGPTTAQKRQGEAYKAMGSMLVTAVKTAKNGEESLTEEKIAQLKEGMNKIDDAQTNGLAVYTRRANEAEAKIQ